MTDIISGLAYSVGGKATLCEMPDHAENHWQQGFYNQIPMLTSQWGDRGTQMGGMQDVDLRMFQHDNDHSFETYGHASGPLISPRIDYPADGQWASDVDMRTPSTTGGFPIENSEGYHIAHASIAAQLHPPRHDDHGASGTSRSGSAQERAPPRHAQSYASNAVAADQRPNISRSITAPEPRNRRSTTSTLEPPALKRCGTSEDGDDDFVPCEDGKNKGKKRQRIPHTAVERRYRENLNAHLDKLRLTVPALAARATLGGESLHEGVKPSKCEILNGAIEHIGALGKENEALKDEVVLLRSRLEELEKWYRSNTRGSAFGA